MVVKPRLVSCRRRHTYVAAVEITVKPGTTTEQVEEEKRILRRKFERRFGPDVFVAVNVVPFIEEKTSVDEAQNSA